MEPQIGQENCLFTANDLSIQVLQLIISNEVMIGDYRGVPDNL
jgi:hypothetical protein